MKLLIIFVVGVVLGYGTGEYFTPKVTAGTCVDSISTSVQDTISNAYNRITGK